MKSLRKNVICKILEFSPNHRKYLNKNTRKGEVVQSNKIK